MKVGLEVEGELVGVELGVGEIFVDLLTEILCEIL